MWIGVADAYGSPISYAQFNYAYQNYGNGWYWVLVGPNQWVYARASGFNQGSAYTDAYDSFRMYLTRVPTSGGGSKK